VRRLLFDPGGNLRPAVLVLVLLLVPLVVLTLAAWGRWAAIVAIAVIVPGFAVAAVFYA
jgi:hypothetical protein